MINIFLIFLVTISSFAADIEALKKEKAAFKAQESNKLVKINHKVEKSDSRVIIIFDKNPISSMSDIETNYNLLLERCLIKRVCIFKKHSNISLNILMKRMKSELNNIEEIKAYKKYQFKQY